MAIEWPKAKEWWCPIGGVNDRNAMTADFSKCDGKHVPLDARPDWIAATAKWIRERGAELSAAQAGSDKVWDPITPLADDLEQEAKE